MINLGGCKINKYKYFEKGFNKLRKNKNYLYYYFISDKNSIINLKNNFHYTLYVIKTSKNKKIKIQDKFIKISNGCSLNNLKNKKVFFPHAGTHLLIAGSKGNKNNKIKKTLYKNHYKVTKPWGYELWINEDKSNHVLKEIFIKRDNKTSLQYHNFKTETNFLFKGSADLFYKKNNKIKNSNVKKKDISKLRIKNFTTVHVNKKVLHRLKAASDIKLYEVSTNFLDDVIRISDDTNRKSGRINSEHKK